MQNFFQLAEGLDVSMLALAVRQNKRKFVKLPADMQPGQLGYTHRAAQLILLRMTLVRGDLHDPAMLEAAKHEHVAQNTPEWGLFPELWPHLYLLMTALRGTMLGRVGIAMIPAGKEIESHNDGDDDFYQRYHLMINGAPKNWAYCGGEKVEMLTGQVWWFDATKEHCFKNESVEPRIYVTLDIHNQ